MDKSAQVLGNRILYAFKFLGVIALRNNVLAYASLLLLTLNIPASGDEVPEAVLERHDDYQHGIAELRKQSESSLTESATEYIAAIENLRKEAQSAGQLEAVLALEEELKVLRSNSGRPGKKSPKETVKFKREFERRATEIEKEFADAVRQRHSEFKVALLEAEKEQTRADRIDSALAVREFRVEFEKRPLPELRSNDAASGTAVAAGEWVDLLEWTEGFDWATRGPNWNGHLAEPATKNGVVIRPMPFNKFPIPAILDGNYEMEVEWTRTDGIEGVAIWFPVGHRTMHLEFGSWTGQSAGVGNIDGKWCDANETTRSPSPITNNQKQTTVIRVTNDFENASFEIDHNETKNYITWTGRYDRLSSGMPMIHHPWVGAYNSRVVFSKIRVRMTSGEIRRDVLEDAQRQRDLREGFVRLAYVAPTAKAVGHSEFMVNQVDPLFWPLIQRDFSVCRDFYGAHAPSSLKIPIPKRMRSFSVVGYNDASRTVKYLINIDGKKVYESGVTDIDLIKVDIPDGAAVLELVVDPAGHLGFDHSYWCYPRFHTSSAQDTNEPEISGRSGTQVLHIASVTVGAGELSRNRPWAPGISSVPLHYTDAVPCNEFFFAHANSSVTFAVPEGMTKFTGIGYNTNSQSVRFELLADAKLIYQSPQAGIIPIEVKLPAGTKQLEMRVDSMGDQFFDFSFWCYPRLHKK